MPEWYKVSNAAGTVVLEVLAYTADGALRDARSRGLDAYTARRISWPVSDWYVED